MHSNRSTFWLSVTALTIVLIFLHFWGLISLHSNKISQALKSNIPIVVELESELNDDHVEQIRQTITNLEEYQSGSVQTYTDSHAYELMEYDFEEIFNDSVANPFSGMITFHIGAPFYYKERLDGIKEQLQSTPGISGVFYQDVSFEGIMDNLSKFKTVVFALSIFFMVLAILLIYNNCQFLLINDRQTIRTMQLVGARNAFIKIPYLKRSLYIGLISFLISIMVVALISFILISNVYLISDILVVGFLGVVFFIVLIVAIILPMISTYIILNLYLKQNSNIYN